MFRSLPSLRAASRHFPSTASTELALPIVLLSASRWSGESHRWSTWTKRFNETGYSCFDIDLHDQSGQLASMESELANELAREGSPFPPLLCAAGLDTLVAQAYVSSRPLSGLLLVDPPLSIAEALKRKPGVLKPDTPEFDFEPFFPVALLTSRARAEAIEAHRLRQDYSEDTRLLVSPKQDDLLGEDGFNRIRDWMDSEGL